LPAGLIDQRNGAVSAQQIDQYLDALEEPERTTLAQLRQMILEILPGAGQGISYGVPAFKVRGKTIAGFAAFKNHLSYLPHSGSVSPADTGAHGFPDLARGPALQHRPAPAEAAGREADRGAAQASLPGVRGSARSAAGGREPAGLAARRQLRTLMAQQPSAGSRPPKPARGVIRLVAAGARRPGPARTTTCPSP
jgi:hypothetical protein